MGLYVLGISASPRKDGNSELLLREALRGAASAGAEAEMVALRDLNIGPCVECNDCYRTGRCRIEDDFQGVFNKMLKADRIIFSTPVFFMTVSAQAKLLIDRFQCSWSQKYVRKKPVLDDPGRDRRAMVVAVGGSRSRKMFDGIRMVMKYFFDVLEVRWQSNLFVNKVDARGDILNHPDALNEAFRLGKELADAQGTPLEKPQSVEFFCEEKQ